MQTADSKGEELNGLGLTLKQIVDSTLRDEEVRKSVKNLNGTLVVREKDAGIEVTIFFHKGNVRIQNDAVDHPSAYVEGGFIELADISSGQVSPLKAFITGKIKAGGNLLKLLKMSKVIISRQ
jgi:putative sterol carrier protein